MATLDFKEPLNQTGISLLDSPLFDKKQKYNLIIYY